MASYGDDSNCGGWNGIAVLGLSFTFFSYRKNWRKLEGEFTWEGIVLYNIVHQIHTKHKTKLLG